MIAAVPARGSVLVEWDPAEDGEARARAAIEAAGREDPADGAPPRIRTVPVVYGGDRGPDLPDVARRLGFTPEELVARHAATTLEVLFCGFAPGFAYLGDLPPELRVPRLRSPRTRTPAGSVAIADGMTGIYPDELPGGWPVIGWTPATIFDATRRPPAYLLPGDLVRFRRVPAAESANVAGAPADW